MSGTFGPGVPRIDRHLKIKMPQVTNLKVSRDMDLSPVGPGTVLNQVVSISAATRDRAILINKTEETRLKRIQKFIEKDHKFKSNLQNRVIERTTKSLKERQALLQLLSKEYKFDNFVTMRPGFDSNQIDSKKVARHYVIESRVFNSGFNMTAMRPEVHRAIRKLDPNEKHRSFKKKLLAETKLKNVEINRAMSNTTFYRMLHDKEHWRDYNLQIKPKLPPETLSNTDEIEKETLQDANVTGANGELHVDRDNVQTETSEQAKEKSVVLEKRLARPKHKAFGMTMRTLGPVYFQASVHSLQNQEIDVKEGS